MQDDSEIIASYIPLVSFLGEVVGRNTEVVLHDLVDIDASVVAIVNGEVSGRTVGSPATDLVLRELEEDSGEQVPYRVHYTARAGGRTLVSSSFFIRRDGRLIGMLCVNTDHTLMRRLESLVAEVSGLFPGAAVDAGAPVSRETLVSSIDGMAAEVIDDVARQRGTSRDRFKPEERLQVVADLHAQGFFQFKGSIPVLASALGVSEPTVYRYVQSARSREGGAGEERAGAGG